MTRATSGPAGCPTGDGRRRRCPAVSSPQASVGSKTRSAARRSRSLPNPSHHRPTRRTGHTRAVAVARRSRGGEAVDVVITHGRKIVSDEVRALTEEKVRHIGEHCPALDRAEVHFSEEHNPRISDRECCEVVMSGHGHTIRARAAGQVAPRRRRPRRREAGAPGRADQGPHRRPVPAPPPHGHPREPSSGRCAPPDRAGGPPRPPAVRPGPRAPGGTGGAGGRAGPGPRAVGRRRRRLSARPPTVEWVPHERVLESPARR